MIKYAVNVTVIELEGVTKCQVVSGRQQKSDVGEGFYKGREPLTLNETKLDSKELTLVYGG